MQKSHPEPSGTNGAVGGTLPSIKATSSIVALQKRDLCIVVGCWLLLVACCFCWCVVWPYAVADMSLLTHQDSDA